MLTGQRTDKQQILERVKLKAGALQTASDALRNDKEVVLEAVKTSVQWGERAGGEFDQINPLSLLASDSSPTFSYPSTTPSLSSPAAPFAFSLIASRAAEPFSFQPDLLSST